MKLNGRLVISVIFCILFTSIIPQSFAGLVPSCIGDINFDFFPDGSPVPDMTRITDQYVQCGVQLFTTEVPEGPQTFAFSEFGGSPPNQLGADGTSDNPAFTHSIGVQFVSPVSEASIIALDVGFNGLILEAFNSASVLVDSVTVINPLSSVIQVDLMTVSGSDIVELIIRQVTPGGKQGFVIDGYNIDDLQFPGPNCEAQTTVIGGEIIPLETTSLILAGAQSFSWMIPVALSVLGIGLFVIKRKNQ